jgi:phosphatidate phosphatase APP1
VRDDDVVRFDIRAWVYEPEARSWSRNAFLDRLRKRLRLDEDSPEARRFDRRARTFLVDNERGQTVRLEIGGETFELGRSAADGHVEKKLEIPSEIADRAIVSTDTGLALRVRAVTDTDHDERHIPLLEDGGRSVISDVDDTVKITGVLDRTQMLLNTFVRPFQPVRGLAEHYRELAARGATFHYVTAGPWQLLPFLEEFLEEYDFPHGSFHMRKLRLKSIRSPIDFVQSSREHKVTSISRLLSDFPARKFTLVGDSGERDPEVYGEIARSFPGQVERILIRRVGGADNSNDRFQKAFGETDAQWSVEELS